MRRLPFSKEYTLKASIKLIYEQLVNPASLKVWYCDDVKINNRHYTFMWKPNEEESAVLTIQTPNYLQYDWDNYEDEYLSFELSHDDLINETSLIVRDFALEEDIDEQEQLWDSYIKKLHKLIG